MHSPIRFRTTVVFVAMFVCLAASTDSHAKETPTAGSVVLLEASEPDGSDAKADRGLLLREVVRQAVLLAAREELNLSTRDAVLGELRATDDKLPRLTVRTKVITGRVYEIELRSVDEKSLAVWAGEIKLPADAPIDYFAVVAAAEKLARTELPAAVLKAGYKKRPEPVRVTGSTPREVIDQIDGMTAVGQFGAARELHSLGGPADPIERLSGLTRAYANLGQLTAFQWTAAHKAFKARSLLYSERLVAVRPQSPFAHWNRAYARALSGFPAAAIDSLAEATKLRDAAPAADRPAVPDWVKLVEAFCHRDYVQLVASTRPGLPNLPLAHLLCYLTLEEQGRGTTFLKFAEKSLAATPDGFRYYDGIFQAGQIGPIHQACEKGPESLLTHFPTKVAALPQLPSAVRDLASSELATAERLEGVIKGLIDAGRPGQDVGEPSWSALGRMAQEVAFVQAARDMERVKRILGRPAAECKEGARSYLPLLVDHPYRDFIASYTVDERLQPDVHKALVRGVPLHDLEATATPLLTQLRRYDVKDVGPGADAARLLGGHRDATAEDLVARLRIGDDAAKAATATRLLRVSPYTTAAVVTLIESDWATVSNKAAEWEKTYADASGVQAALGKKYAELKQYEDAERCLKANTRLAADHAAFTALAEVYKARGDRTRWKETLDDYLKTDDLGLDHARVQVSIADYLLSVGKAQEAKPYALAAAETGAGWAMMSAARTQEALGDWAEAEKFVRETAEQYETSQHAWLFWCLRTGRGDVAAARKLALDRVETARGSNDATIASISLVARVTAGESAEAYKELKAHLKATPSNRLMNLHAALLAHELGEPKERDDWLDLSIKRSTPLVKKDGADTPPVAPPTRTTPAPLRPTSPEQQAKVVALYAAAGELAKVIRPVLAANPPGAVDGKKVEEIINSVDPIYRAEIEYVAGRFYELTGRPENAMRHYKAGVATAGSDRMATVLSAFRLRELEKKPGK